MARSISLILVLFCGCTATTVKTPAKAPPTLPIVRRAFIATNAPVQPLTYNLPDFRYPSGIDPCKTYWTLQGSSNLVTWVDLETYWTGCSTNATDQTNGTMYFYRLKGTVQ